MKEKGLIKTLRALGIYSRLMHGKTVNKHEEAARYGVSSRSIQRDIEEIRNYLMEPDEHDGVVYEVVYCRRKDGYILEKPS